MVFNRNLLFQSFSGVLFEKGYVNQPVSGWKMGPRNPWMKMPAGEALQLGTIPREIPEPAIKESLVIWWCCFFSVSVKEKNLATKKKMEIKSLATLWYWLCASFFTHHVLYRDVTGCTQRQTPRHSSEHSSAKSKKPCDIGGAIWSRGWCIFLLNEELKNPKFIQKLS